jgi:hypothetical protein
MIKPLMFVCMDVVTGGRKCLVNFNKLTLQLSMLDQESFGMRSRTKILQDCCRNEPTTTLNDHTSHA